MPTRISPRRARTGALALSASVAASVLLAGPASAHQPPASYPASPLTTVKGHVRGNGDIFITPTSAAGTSNGAQIVDKSGRTVWFHRAATGTVDADFRTQRLDGRPVLTFWEGTNFGGLSDGTDYIYNDRYQQIAAVHAGPGLTTDGHEFLLGDHGTAWVLSYDTATADLTSIGGPSNQTVIDGIVQKIDIRTGRVLFSWNSADHVPYGQSEQPLPGSAGTPWDWFHVNAIHVDTDGALLIDARDTWTAYKVDPRSGRIIWQLGGKASSFTLAAANGQTLNNAGRIFAWQHDINGHGRGIYTVFDNESAGAGNTGADASSELDHSRVVTIALDTRTKRATLVQSDNEPDGLLAPSQGNGQQLRNGDVFIGWGALNAVSEFDRHGRLVFDARFPTGVNTYRAYLLQWGSRPRH
jgi:hypothetical protein